MIFRTLCFVLSLSVCAGSYGYGELALKGKITVSGAWALYPMTVRWAEEFRKVYPGVTIDISAGGAGKGMADVVSGMVDIGMVSRAINPVEVEKGAYAIAVTKDAVIPTANVDNPYIREISEKGVKRQSFVDIWITGKITDWSGVYPDAQAAEKAAISVYTRSDACGAAETWAKYLGGNQEDLQGVGVYGDPGLADAVVKDRLGIGFNNVNFAYDATTKKPAPGLKIIPIDLDENGMIDPGEDFYGDRDSLMRAIAEGRYPSPPARDLYFVTKGKPGKDVLVRFIEWVLTDGQKYVPEAGYINLGEEKIKGEIKKLK